MSLHHKRVLLVLALTVLLPVLFWGSCRFFNHDRNNQRRSAPRTEQVYKRPAPPPEPQQTQEKSGAEYYRLKTGTGINTELLVYEGKKYILVYSTQNGGMTIIEHKSP